MTILVTGATGNIGRRVVDELLAAGATDIRALTTNPAQADLPDGVTAVTGFLGKPDSLPAALDGVEAMYLAPFPPTLDATLDLARRAGVAYVVALSGGAHWQAHADAVAASGLPHTQLGPGEFCENFAIWSEAIKSSGTVREPYPDVVEAPISMDDIARVAAHLLVAADTKHHGVMYELTGPQALTRAQIAEQIGVGAGVPVRFTQCSRAEAEQALRPVMGDEARWYLDLMAGAQPQHANSVVEQLTGTPAMSVAQWAARNASLFR
ncbi:SDR family oxidoreductase [Mycobacterium sp. SMC-4]|uniref:SDR family oxidoreductase n=1 Tax=Mycobacterium sp. SMC-4 TaxID=2857059 RepID=UPI003D08846A